MKVSKENANYAVVYTAFHGGGTVGFYKTLTGALMAEKKYSVSGCCCGCCGVVALNQSAVSELLDINYYYEEVPLYDDLPNYNGNNSPYSLCK